MVYDPNGPYYDYRQTPDGGPWDEHPEASADFSFQRSHGFHEGQREHPAKGKPAENAELWSVIDSIRWGDADTIAATITVGLAPAPVTLLGKQLVRANTPRPVVWLVQLNTGPNQVPPGETNPITLTYAITYGCGQAQTTMNVTIVLTAANGYQLPPGTTPPQLYIPAQDLNINCSLGYTPIVAGSLGVAVAAMSSPFTRWD